MSVVANQKVDITASADMEYLTAMIGEQIFGIPVLDIQDIIQEQLITPIPLAPPEIAGALNLRGRVVTAIDMRKMLGVVEDCEDVDKNKKMNVVIEHDGELYSLMVDNVGDVLVMSQDTFEKNPTTMEESWSSISSGIHRLEDRLLVVIDVDGLLQSFDNG